MFILGTFTNYLTTQGIIVPTPDPILPTPPVITPPVDNSPEFKFRTTISLKPDGSNVITTFMHGFYYKNIEPRLNALRQKHGFIGNTKVHTDFLPIENVSRGTLIEDSRQPFYLWIEYDELEDVPLKVNTESYFVLQGRGNTTTNHKTTVIADDLRSYSDIQFNRFFETTDINVRLNTNEHTHFLTLAPPYFRVSDVPFNSAFTKFNYTNINGGLNNFRLIPTNAREANYKTKFSKRKLIGRFNGNYVNVLPIQVLIKTKVGDKTEYHVVLIPGTKPETILSIQDLIPNNEIIGRTTSGDVYFDVPQGGFLTDYCVGFKVRKGINVNRITEEGKQIANQRQGEVTGQFSYINDILSESGELCHVRMMKPGRNFLLNVPYQQVEGNNPNLLMWYLRNDFTNAIITDWFSLGILQYPYTYPNQ